MRDATLSVKHYDPHQRLQQPSEPHVRHAETGGPIRTAN